MVAHTHEGHLRGARGGEHEAGPRAAVGGVRGVVVGEGGAAGGGGGGGRAADRQQLQQVAAQGVDILGQCHQPWLNSWQVAGNGSVLELKTKVKERPTPGWKPLLALLHLRNH